MRHEAWNDITDEDAAILARSLELPSVLLDADDTDYRAMLAREQDKRALARGFDPYNSRARRAADIAAFTADQKREAEQTLACYETELTIKE